MSITTINPYDLQPGEWVIFTHDQEVLPKNLQGPFKVINRYDTTLDHCRCFLMNFEGLVSNYYPDLCMLKYQNLPREYTVAVIDQKVIANKLGKRRMEIIQKKAIDCLKILAQSNYGSKYLGRGFNPEDNGSTLTLAEIRKKYIY